MEESRKEIPVEEKFDIVYCPYCRTRNTLPDNWENDLQEVSCSSCNNSFASIFINDKADEKTYKACSNCHMNNMFGAKFCIKCGNEYYIYEESKVIPSDKFHRRKRLDSTVIFLLIFMFLSVLGMILTWIFAVRAPTSINKLILIITFFIFCAFLILDCIICLILIFISLHYKRKKLKEEM